MKAECLNAIFILIVSKMSSALFSRLFLTEDLKIDVLAGESLNKRNLRKAKSDRAQVQDTLSFRLHSLHCG